VEAGCFLKKVEGGTRKQPSWGSIRIGTIRAFMRIFGTFYYLASPTVLPDVRFSRHIGLVLVFWLGFGGKYYVLVGG